MVTGDKDCFLLTALNPKHAQQFAVFTYWSFHILELDTIITYTLTCCTYLVKTFRSLVLFFFIVAFVSNLLK